MFQECRREASLTTHSSARLLVHTGPSLRTVSSFSFTFLSKISQLLSEVEVLQVYRAQCAREKVEVLLGEIHRAVQGALQARGQAGVPGEEGQVRERGGRAGGRRSRGGGDGGVLLLGERGIRRRCSCCGPGLAELQQARVWWGVVSRSSVRGARCSWQRWAAQTASLLRCGLRIVAAVSSVGGG